LIQVAQILFNNTGAALPERFSLVDCCRCVQFRAQDRIVTVPNRRLRAKVVFGHLHKLLVVRSDARENGALRLVQSPLEMIQVFATNCADVFLGADLWIAEWSVLVGGKVEHFG